MARSTFVSLLFPLFVAVSLPLAAHAQDEDLDDLPDDFLQDGGNVKVRDAEPAPEEEESFDFGDDPDWDAAPDPVPVPAGLDDDPSEQLFDAAGPNDAFFDEDPPDDIARSAPSADPLDADPPEGAGGASRPSAGPALGLGFSTKGKAVLGDNFPAKVVARDLDAVVIELPVLVASKPADFAADYWLITEVLVADRKVAESRHLVTRASVADMGPTVVWSKSHVPVLERAGSIELRVSQESIDGNAAPLFTKTVGYEL